MNDKFTEHHFAQALAVTEPESLAFHMGELTRRFERATQRVHFTRWMEGKAHDADKALAYVGLRPETMAAEVERVKAERAKA